MSSVDERIVNMQFNSKQFTQGAAESQRALQSLESSVARTARSGGLNEMGRAVDGVTSRFSALQIAGVTAVATIAHHAVEAGLQLAKSLTIEPIMAGFSEYTTNLNSIQTIMANTGATVDKTNRYLNELNQYSDQTIYNFSQMASAIGRFTAAGVSLPTATTAIKGMANVAALSGSSAEQLNMAMYQMSQALASGTIRLMDWNSLVNAGMGGKNLQNALQTTAESMGMNVDAMIKKYGSFRDSLTEGGWLTTDVFNQTMAAFTNDFSKKQLMAMGYNKQQAAEMKDLAKRAGDAATKIKTFPQLMQVVKESIASVFSQSFTAILGNFEQSKLLWTNVGDVITDRISSWGAALNTVLFKFGKKGGRWRIIAGLRRMFEQFGKVLGAVGDAFRDVFPPGNPAQTLYRMAVAFNKFTKELVLSDDTVDHLRTIFTAVFSVLKIGLAVVKGITQIFIGFFGALLSGSKDSAGGVLELLAAVGEIIIKFQEWLTEVVDIQGVLRDVGATAGAFIRPVAEAIGAVVSAFASLVTGGSGGLSGLSGPFNEATQAVSNFISSGLNKIQGPLDAVRGFFEDVAAKIREFTDSLSNVDSPMDEVTSKVSDFKGTAGRAMDHVAGKFDKVAGSTTAVQDSLTSMYDSFKTKVSGPMTSGSNALSDAAENSEGTWQKVKDVIEDIYNGVKKTLSAVGRALSWIGDKIDKVFEMDAFDLTALVNMFLTGSLIWSIRGFSKSVGNAFDALSGALGGLQRDTKPAIIMALAVGVSLLVASMLVLSQIDEDALVRGTAAVGAMMGMMAGMLLFMTKMGTVDAKFKKGPLETIPIFNANLLAMAGAMLILAAAMVAMAFAVKIFSKIPVWDLVKGMAAMAVSLALLVGAMALISKMKGTERAAATILALAVAMNLLATAVMIFGSMDLATLAKGVGGMAVSLALMAGALYIMSKGGDAKLAGAAVAILAMGVAMNMLAAAVLAFGKMDPETLKQGLTGLAWALGMMTVALLALSFAAGGVALAGAGILMLSMAMGKMVVVILALGVAPWSVVEQGLKAVAIALGILLAAGALAMVVAPGLIVLGVVILALGAAMMLAGAGMLMFGTGFAVFVGAAALGIAAITALFQVFLAMLPTLAMQLATAFIAFLTVIARAAPRIRAALGVIFENMIGVVVDAIPQFGKVIQALLDVGIQLIRKNAGKWIEAGFMIIDRFLKSAEKHAPNISRSVLSIIEIFLTEMAARMERIVNAGTKLLVKFLNGIGSNAGKITQAAADLILDILWALEAAIRNNDRRFQQVGLAIASAVANAVSFGLSGMLTDKFNQAMNNPMSLVGGSRTAGKVASAFDTAPAVIDAALAAAHGTLSLDPDVQDKAGIASRKQAEADRAAAAASQAAQIAAEARRKANKTKGKAAKKKAEAAAKKAERIAANKTAAANRAQRIADNAYQGLADAQAFSEADEMGKGDIRAEQANELADTAQGMLAQALADKKKAQKALRDAKNKKQKDAARKMLAAAEDLARRAQEMAGTASAFAAEAEGLYAAAITARIQALEEEVAADEKARVDQALYDAADNEGKIAIMEARAKESQRKADEARARYLEALGRAKALNAAGDTLGAEAALEEAEAAAAKAEEFAEQAKQEKDQAAQLAGQAGQAGSTTGGGGGTISPSRTVMEDAAKAVDRWTASLQQAQELAAATQTVVQYNQNNYSPKAISPAETYRLGKTLMAAQEVKMGVPPSS